MKRPSTILRKDKIDTIAIGSFDGIHLGHMQLINRLGDNGALFVIDKDHANLTPGIKRSEYSRYPCMYYHFLKVKDLSGEEFVELLKKEFVHLKKIVVGYDFQFGKKRSCDAKDLKRIYEGEVEIVEEFTHDGIAVHSTIVRELLRKGDVEKANGFLGREYAILGESIKGQGLGKEELFPTINLDIRDYLLPKSGVYATRTYINKHVYNSVSFIGNRESTDGKFSVETHIIDKSLEVKEYENVEVFFVQRLRNNKKFDDLSELKEQIARDIKDARDSLKVCKFYHFEFL